MSEVSKHCCNRIREVRKSKGLNQRQFAKEFGVEHGLIARIETYRQEPTVRFILSICEKYNYSLDWFCGLVFTIGNNSCDVVA
jgi:transcriptional regulator with XRE-family HTH domain